MDDAQHEIAPGRLSFLVAGLLRDAFGQGAGMSLVSGLDVGEVAEQLAHAGVGGARRGAAIEVGGFLFHRFGALAHGVDVEGLAHPHRLAADEAAHVVAADQRNVLAETLAEEVDQHLAMAVLLLGHALEHLGGGREIVAQALDEIAIDARVLLLVLDGKGEHLAIRQVGEGALGREGEEGHWRVRAVLVGCRHNARIGAADKH